MANKEKSADVLSGFVEAFRCPHCKASMKVVQLKSLVCTNNHTFDFAKQGYVHMMSRPTKNHYSKPFFAARQKMIAESRLYALLHERIAEVIQEHRGVPRYPFLILDAGCGEGSHLQKILDECSKGEINGVGLDISKDGIVMASKNYKKNIWLVGDIAKSPFDDQCFHAILNIFSPSNYKEFKRILVQNGLVIKVVPGPNYLKELRESLFYEAEKKVYKNDETVSLFNKHFKLTEVINLCYTKKLNPFELENLVRMSPLSWTSDKAQINAFTDRGSMDITIDLDILIGLNE